MSSKGSAGRLQIECRHNPTLSTLFVGCILLAAACLLNVSLSWPLTGFALLLLFSLAWRTWSSRCELGGARVTLLWDGEGRWWWQQGGEECELHLAGDSYLSSWLIVLNLVDASTKRGHAMLLFPSSTGRALFRRLSVRLRLEGRASILGRPGHSDAGGYTPVLKFVGVSIVFCGGCELSDSG